MGLLLLVIFGVLYCMLGLVIAYVLAAIVVGIYNVIKYALIALYDDWLDMRAVMARDAATLRRIREGGETAPDQPTGQTPRQPALAEAISHVIRHPSMDGLVTGVDDSVVTRFNRR